MNLIETSAYVLDCSTFRESSLLLRLVTEKAGRVDAVAKGARRVKGALLDRFCRIFAVWRPPRRAGQLVTLTRFDVEAEPRSLRESYLAYLLSCFWAEAVLALEIAEDENSSAFRLTQNFFSLLENSETAMQPNWRVLSLFWEFLKSHGVMGAWDECAHCGAKAELSHFSWEHMAPLCAHCVLSSDDVFPLSYGLVSALQRANHLEGRNHAASLHVLAEFALLVGAIIERVAGKRLPSVALIMKFVEARG